MSTPDVRSTAAFTGLLDLASAQVGGQVMACSDDFFAEKENLLKPGRAVFDPQAYTDRGKLMDGWESRRKRVPGHDWAIVRLGVPGRVRGVDIDTDHFLGNHPPHASLDGCRAPVDASPEELELALWDEILPDVPLDRGSRNLFAVSRAGPWTHLRLHIYPDGGVARLRVYGEPEPQDLEGTVDLASAVNGGRAVAASDMFFGDMNNLVSPGEAENMGGGWETRRRRTDGHDWIVVELARPGVLHELEIDTKHFKGNYPDRAWVEGICWPGAPVTSLLKSPDWRPVTATRKLRPDHDLVVTEVLDRGPFTHLRLNVAPCGGVSRLRVWGDATDLVPQGAAQVLANLDATSRREALARACGSSRWVQAMLAHGHFASEAALLGHAEREWWRLSERDWKEAFTHHPRIGDDVAALRERFQTTAELSAGEQSGVQGASEVTLQALAQGNRAYQDRFGFIFIVCATGRSADEMLAVLQERLHNDPVNEVRIAAGEQAKITRLRLLGLR